jgi:selenide,water dikinase
LGPTQLSDVLRQLPRSANPNLLVGFETSDDAGVFRLPGGITLVQTVDFFTPIVDDPYAYGAIAAANALSDVYAMGGTPITALNIACFSPDMAPAEIWSEILRGAYEKVVESGAVLLGGHSVEDKEPKFGMAVTGLIDPSKMFENTQAKPGDRIYLSKPLGTGIVSTAAKFDAADSDHFAQATQSMMTLNKDASTWGIDQGVRCATDITGFGLAGHLFHIAKASKVHIQINHQALPLLTGVMPGLLGGFVTGGATKNAAYLGDSLTLHHGLPDWVLPVMLDPQTSGGLALFSTVETIAYPCIGQVVVGQPGITVF